MKKILSVCLILLLVFLPGCAKLMAKNSLLPLSEDGYIELIVPENLLGGKGAEDFEADYINIKNSESGNKADNIVSKVVANDDGTASMFFTPSQLETYKQNTYFRTKYHERYDNISIKNVIYENEMLSEITVIVEQPGYNKSLMDKSMANILLAVNAGMYQILCGTPPDEWHTTITVKDEATGEVISVNEFPNDDMYKVY